MVFLCYRRAIIRSGSIISSATTYALVRSHQQGLPSSVSVAAIAMELCPSCEPAAVKG